MIELKAELPVVAVPPGSNPVREIMNSAQHGQVAEALGTHPFWSDAITSHNGVALLFSLVRALRFEDVAEIGSFRGKTTYMLAKALEMNGVGHVHTVGPYDAHHFLPLFEQWPKPLQNRTTFHTANSAEFFSSSIKPAQRFDLVFVDGNHDYEYAMFDIQCAAMRTRPGGMIVIDNIEQGGPISAALQFLAENPSWKDLSLEPMTDFPSVAYDRGRMPIPGTGFVVIQSPVHQTASRRPRTFGAQDWSGTTVRGIETGSDTPVTVQCVLRSFGPGRLYEEIATGYGAGTVTFDPPLTVHENDRYSVEVWITAPATTTLSFIPRPI
jgi:predicted O-methyltransferase YrrM